MESYIESFCAGCAGTRHLIDIDECYSKNPSLSYYDLLENCFGINRDQMGNLLKICKLCARKLMYAYNFKLEIESTLEATKSYIPVKVEDIDATVNPQQRSEESKIEYLDIELFDDYPGDFTETDILNEAEFLEEDSKDILEYVTQRKRSTEIAKFDLDEFESKRLTWNKKIKKRKTPFVDELPFELMQDETSCPLCSKSFNNNRLLIIHMNDHYPNFVCSICDKGFAMKRSLIRHQRTHEEGPFECKFCDKEFKSANTLAGHIQFTHKNSSRKACSFCGMRFQLPLDLKVHRKEAHGIDHNFSCPYCDKSFNDSRRLNKHKRYMHEKDAHHSCMKCTKIFSSGSRLTDHMVEFHNEDPPEGVQITQCDKCAKRFSNTANFKIHMALHDKALPPAEGYSCHICQTTYKTRKSYRSHMRTKHEGSENQQVHEFEYTSYIQVTPNL